jgi:hypothetical protein
MTGTGPVGDDQGLPTHRGPETIKVGPDYAASRQMSDRRDGVTATWRPVGTVLAMKTLAPVITDRRFPKLLDRLAARGTRGWTLDGWGFVLSTGQHTLRLGTPGAIRRGESAQARLDVVGPGRDEPLFCMYAADYPQVAELYQTLTKAAPALHRNAAQVLDELLAELGG